MDRIRKFEPLWGVWKCESVLGEGAFGRVYKATRQEGNHIYHSAVKHISVPANEQQIQEIRTAGFYKNEKDISKYFEAVVRDVQSEIDLMYRLKGSANIVSYEDHLIIPKASGIGCDIFIRMELLTPLTSILTENMPIRDAVKIGTDICTALEMCARAKIIHRDIKPSNIFVNAYGDYKLGDFGIARVTGGATAGMSKKGTYNYMAPEIYKCEPANLTSDIYSLGVVLYRILNCNRLPFMPMTGMPMPRHYEEATVKMVSGAPMPPPKNATPQLAAVILKACAYNKRDRYQSAAEFRKALNDAMYGANPVNTMADNDRFYEETVVSERTQINSNRSPYSYEIAQRVSTNTLPDDEIPDDDLDIRMRIQMREEEEEKVESYYAPTSVQMNNTLYNSRAFVSSPMFDYQPEEDDDADIRMQIQMREMEEEYREQYVVEDRKTEINRNIGNDEENYARAHFIFRSSGNNEVILERCVLCESKMHIPYKVNGKIVAGIGKGAFRRCEKLTSITIPNSIRSIEQSAFEACSFLESVSLPRSVTVIRESVFEACARLKNVLMPSSITEICARAFSGCKSLVSVNLPVNLQNIGAEAFFGCTSLKNFVFPDNLRSIGDGAFSCCTRIQSQTIPRMLNHIGKNAFSSCNIRIYAHNKPSYYGYSADSGVSWNII